MSNVTVEVNDPLGPDGESILNVASGRERSFALIAAGAMTNAEVRLEVPRGVPFGIYSGTVSVESENAGGQTVAVQVTVLPMGDYNSNESVDLFDHAAFVGCFGGPGDGPIPVDCRIDDFDGDDDVDLRDVGAFQNVFSYE